MTHTVFGQNTGRVSRKGLVRDCAQGERRFLSVSFADDGRQKTPAVFEDVHRVEAKTVAHF